MFSVLRAAKKPPPVFRTVRLILVVEADTFRNEIACSHVVPHSTASQWEGPQLEYKVTWLVHRQKVVVAGDYWSRWQQRASVLCLASIKVSLKWLNFVDFSINYQRIIHHIALQILMGVLSLSLSLSLSLLRDWVSHRLTSALCFFINDVFSA